MHSLCSPTGLRGKSGRHQEHLGALFIQMSIELREAEIVADAHAKGYPIDLKGDNPVRQGSKIASQILVPLHLRQVRRIRKPIAPFDMLKELIVVETGSKLLVIFFENTLRSLIPKFAGR